MFQRVSGHAPMHFATPSVIQKPASLFRSSIVSKTPATQVRSGAMTLNIITHPFPETDNVQFLKQANQVAIEMGMRVQPNRVIKSLAPGSEGAIFKAEQSNPAKDLTHLLDVGYKNLNRAALNKKDLSCYFTNVRTETGNNTVPVSRHKAWQTHAHLLSQLFDKLAQTPISYQAHLGKLASVELSLNSYSAPQSQIIQDAFHKISTQLQEIPNLEGSLRDKTAQVKQGREHFGKQLGYRIQNTYHEGSHLYAQHGFELAQVLLNPFMKL
jgi:hypothetical protein